jgi:cell division septum initiation protein DivIVA
MSDQSHLSADLGHEDQFEREMRGYSRRAVDEYVAALRIDLRGLEDGKRDLEDRLSQSLDEMERLKLDLSAARTSDKPAHEEISERIGQILKLAEDEARSQRAKADDEIAKLRADAQADTGKLRADAKAETDRHRAEAQEQAERMLNAAQEQAETTIATAKAESDAARKSAATEAQQVVADATRQAETAVATAKSQAKQQLDEATARATAIHDGAERRLNLLMSRHTEAVRRLTEIRDVVTTLVAGEADRGSLEDEVARIVTGAAGDGPQGRPGNGRPGGLAEGRHAGGNGQPELSTAQRPGQPAVAGQPVAANHPVAANQPVVGGQPVVAGQPGLAGQPVGQGHAAAPGHAVTQGHAVTSQSAGRPGQAPAGPGTQNGLGNGQRGVPADARSAPAVGSKAEADDTDGAIRIIKN